MCIKHIKITLTKGFYLIKILKILRLIKHTYYYIISKRIDKYSMPDAAVEEVGYFDKKGYVHINKNYENSIKGENISSGNEYIIMKKGLVSLVGIDNQVIVRKTYRGLWKYFHFYNELICLNRLRNIQGVCNLKYVDYKNITLYLLYIDGFTLNRNNLFKVPVITSSNIEKYASCFRDILKDVHSNGVYIYDLRHANMIIYNYNECYYIDFSDSFYFDIKLKKILNKYLINEMKKPKKVLKKVVRSEGTFKIKVLKFVSISWCVFTSTLYKYPSPAKYAL